MHASQNEPAKNLTDLETVLWAQEPKSSEQRIFAPKSESELLTVRRGGNAPQSARAPNLTGFETDLWAQDLKSGEQHKLTSKSESELLAAHEFSRAANPIQPWIELSTSPSPTSQRCLPLGRHFTHSGRRLTSHLLRSL